MHNIKKIILIFIGFLIISGLAWAGNFGWDNLRGIGPAFKAPSDDISEIIKQNNTDFPLILPNGFSIDIFSENLPNVRVIKQDVLGNFWISQTKEGLVTLLENKDGKIIIFVPDKKFQKSLIFTKYLSKGHLWAKMLDRGISNNIKHCYTFKEWKTLFSKVGLKIDYHSNYGTEQLVKFWSIGLRPYSPFLIEMANNLNLKTRTKIKQKLIKDLVPLLKSYVDFEMSVMGKNNCFHLFVLKK